MFIFLKFQVGAFYVKCHKYKYTVKLFLCHFFYKQKCCYSFTIICSLPLMKFKRLNLKAFQENISLYAVYPGVCGTNIKRHMGVDKSFSGI